MTQLADVTSEKKVRGSKLTFDRAFVLVMASATVTLLIAVAFVAIVFGRGGAGTQLSEYELQAIEVVSMQNEITVRWNQTVDMFNGSDVSSQLEHVILFTASLDSVHDLITDSQAVINRWTEIDVPDKHVSSYQLGLEALMATQDGLILFEEYFQDSVDTLVADQLRAGEASAKLVHAAQLWQAAAEVAAEEG
ncbi:MAG: hypothetical protein O6922_02065 [Chloroflexi bacterium]|nr:hypothetical protein [Chloroflexota bacterium]